MKSSLLCLLAVSLCVSSVLGYTARTVVNVRVSPSSHAFVLNVFGAGSTFNVYCQVNGENIQGPAGTTNVWYYIPIGRGFVSGADVSNDGQSAPPCSPIKVNMPAGQTLNVYASPNTHSGVVGSLNADAEIDVDCQIPGDNISGTSGTTSIWYHVPARGGYVIGAYISTAGRSFYTCGNFPSDDCSAGLKNPRSCSEAVAWATAHLTTIFHSDYRGMSDHFVGLAYGRSASGFDTAFTHWRTTPERFRHYDKNPPPGALCFFKTSAAGHVCLSTGGGNIICTDWFCSGCLSKGTINLIEVTWGGPYLGWTNPYFHNA